MSVRLSKEARTWVLALIEERHECDHPLEGDPASGVCRCSECGFEVTVSDLIRVSLGRPALMEQSEEVREQNKAAWEAAKFASE